MPLRVRNVAPWGSFVVASCFLIWLYCHHWSHMTHPEPNAQPCGVFGTFWASGWAARHNHNPFLEYPPLTWRPHAFGHDGPLVLDLNLNPPAVLPLFSLWSRVPPLTGALMWAAVSTLLFIGTAGVLIRRYNPERRQVWWLLTCSATILTLGLQQIYAILLVLCVAIWFLLESEHDIEAGVLLGVLTAVKPNLALWPLLLALSGRLKPILPACVTAAALSIVPIFLYGPGVYSEWWQATQIDSHSIFPVDISIAGNLTRLGSRPAGLAIAFLVLLLLIYLVWATKPPLYETTGIALSAAILCSPLGWLEYILLLAPLLFARRWTRSTTIAALLLWINPAFIDPQPYPSHWSVFFRGLIYFIPMCMLLAEYCRPALRTLTSRWQQNDYELSPLRDSQ
jgi:hypothetical protein